MKLAFCVSMFDFSSVMLIMEAFAMVGYSVTCVHK